MKKLIPVMIQIVHVTMTYAEDESEAKSLAQYNMPQIICDIAEFADYNTTMISLDPADKKTFKKFKSWENCIPWGEEDSRTCSKILEDMEEENLKANLTKEQIDKILNQLSAEEVKFMLQN